MIDHKIPQTQLWKEEYEILSGVAASVPDGGTIVEIGTADGGSAWLMHRAVEGRRIQIYTVDVSPSREALATLEGTGVISIAQPSRAFAETWGLSSAPPIDFLFIDGDHTLDGVVGDWNAWAPFLRPGGTVAIHDFDPVERGGIVHLAIRVAVETILAHGFMLHFHHKYKLAYGILEAPRTASLSANACAHTLKAIGRHIVGIRDANHSHASVVADPRLVLLLDHILHADGTLAAIPVDRVCNPGTQYIASPHPGGESPESLRKRGVPEENITVLDSLTLCYLLAHAVKADYARLRADTGARNEFIFWAEILSMFEHAFGPFLFPDDVCEHHETSIRQLSRLIAGEQTRLTMLARILRTFVDWTP